MEGTTSFPERNNIKINNWSRSRALDCQSRGHAVEHWTVNRGDSGSIPPTAVSKLSQFRSPHICLCLSEETLKTGGPFYLVSIPGEVKDPTQGVNM